MQSELSRADFFKRRHFGDAAALAIVRIGFPDAARKCIGKCAEVSDVVA